jgi:hypothetical protein
MNKKHIIMGVVALLILCGIGYCNYEVNDYAEKQMFQDDAGMILEE